MHFLARWRSVHGHALSPPLSKRGWTLLFLSNDILEHHIIPKSIRKQFSFLSHIITKPWRKSQNFDMIYTLTFLTLCFSIIKSTSHVSVIIQSKKKKPRMTTEQGHFLSRFWFWCPLKTEGEKIQFSTTITLRWWQFGSQWHFQFKWVKDWAVSGALLLKIKVMFVIFITNNEHWQNKCNVSVVCRHGIFWLVSYILLRCSRESYIPFGTKSLSFSI